MISSKQIINKIEKFKIDELPKNLIDQELNILTQGMKEDEIKNKKKDFEEEAKKRIKTGLILNEFAEQNKIQVTNEELQNEIQKQIRMMPGQEKMVMDFYQKNPSALASLRGTVYEEKIIKLIKTKAKANKKNISKDEAEKILKAAHDHSHDHPDENAKPSSKKADKIKKAKPKATKDKTIKKVSKK